jgi:hypothetical protein
VKQKIVYKATICHDTLIHYDRTDIKYMTTSVSQRLAILCITFKIIMLRLLITPVVSSNISCNDTVRPVICDGGGITTKSVIFHVLCRSLFVLLYFFFWPLCYRSFDSRILITPLVFSNSSYIQNVFK